MSMKDWSTTAASNATIASNSGINWQEGQAPSTINDSARAMMTDVRAWYESAEWIDLGHAPTYASGTSFTVPGDKTAIYTVGRRVKLYNGSSTFYATISAVSFSTNTTVTVVNDGSALSGTLSTVAVGIINPANSSLPRLFTSGRVPYATTGGVLVDSSSFLFSIPGTNQVILTLGNGAGTASSRNVLYMAPGGFSDQPGNQSTASDGDKIVLYDGANRSAMGIGSDYNWWSQSKTFEWWLSPNNLSSTVKKQLSLAYNALDFGSSNDSVPRRISIAYSTVPLYLSNSYDGSKGISTISNNIWNTSNGSYSWSSFNNTGYAAASIQLYSTTAGSYINWGASNAVNTTPTAGGWLDKYGVISGNATYNRNTGGPTPFANWFSCVNLNADGSSNRVAYFEGNAVSGGSNWYGIGTTQSYANDWDTNTWSRWVNVSSNWYKTHEVVKNTGMETQFYNPAFLYEVATGASYGSGWNKILYNVAGGSRTLSRSGVGYDGSGTFTAPQAGWYFFSAQISFSSSNDTDGTIKLIVNGNTSAYSPSSSALGGSQYPGSRQVSGVIYLSSGDYVEVYCYFSGATNVVRGSQPYAGSFSGHFIG